MIESTKNQSFHPRAEWVELESGEWVTRRQLELRWSLALAVIAHQARREGDTLILVTR